MTVTTIRTRRALVAGAALTVALGLGGCGLVQAGSDSGSGPVATVDPGGTSTSEPSTPTTDEGATTPATPSATDTPSSTSTTATPSSTAAPTPSTTAKPKPQPTPSTTPKPKPTPTVNPNLIRPGDKGPEVLAVQKRLGELGYWLGTADGTYGDLTAQAVLALQKVAGIGRDGTLGPATKKALDDGVRPKPNSTADGMEIDLARQVITLVRGGKVTMILNTSTGSGQTYTQQGSQHVASTPKGSFTTFRSVDGEDKAPLGVLWRPRYFNQGIAVHGYTSVPAYPASHGCARVSNQAMNMIWSQNLMPINGRVTVL